MRHVCDCVWTVFVGSGRSARIKEGVSFEYELHTIIQPVSRMSIVIYGTTGCVGAVCESPSFDIVCTLRVCVCLCLCVRVYAFVRYDDKIVEKQRTT